MMNRLSKLSRNYAPGACTGRTRRRAPAAGQHVRYFQSCHIACRGRCLASADGPSSAEIATTLEGVFAAARGTDIEQQAESQRIVECLRRMVLISKIWPVYAWDPSPPIFALMVTTQAALDELNLSGATVTEAELQRALRSCGIETSNADERLRSELSPRRFNRRGSRLVSLGP